MEKYQIQITKKLTAAVLILAMLFTMIPASVAYGAETYGFQPEDADNSSNSMKMLEPSKVTVLESTGDYYLNKIEETVDGTKDIEFSFTMSAGMNNFQKEWFLEKNMPLIKVYDAKEERVVAEGNAQNTGGVKFLRSHFMEGSDSGNNHGGTKTEKLDIGIDQGVLGTGDYVLVFGKDICGNNADKRFGKDIKFQFQVKAAPDLKAMIEQAKEFAAGAETGTSPGQYPQEAADKINTAIETAETIMNSGADEETQKQAAETLYTALQEFKASVNYEVSQIDISGIDSQVYVGDSGTAAAQVTVNPDRAEFKKVTWSVVKAQGSDEPADNIRINETTGKWVAAYSGTAYIKAVSSKSPDKAAYKQVQIETESGVTAVNLTEKDSRLQSTLEKTGQDVSSITSLKVFTTDQGELSAEDLSFIKSKMTALQTLNMKNAQLGSLDSSALSGHAGLETVILPDTLLSIGQRAFYNCVNLKKLDIPASVTSIGSGAFAGCTALAAKMTVNAVYPPDYAVTGIFGDAFDGKDGDDKASVTAIQVPYGCAADYKAKAGWRSFTITESPQCKLDITLTAPGTLAEAAQAALDSKGITEDQVTDLKISSKAGVQMERSTDVNQYLQKNFLYATTIDLSETEFEDNKCNANTFKDRISLKRILLPESTVTIGGTCFSGCKNLRGITLPADLGNIGSGAFDGCDMIGSRIVVGAVTPPTYDGTVFPDSVTTMVVPPQSVDLYKKTVGWKNYEILSQVALSLSAKSLALEATGKKVLTANITVYNNNNDTVTWSSSNERVASVSPERGKTTTVTGVKPGTAVITAKAANGYVTAACTVTVTAMDAPKAKAASAGYNKINVSWSGVSGAAGYEIYRGTNPGGPYTKIRTLTSGYRSYIDTGRATGTTYYYKVRAYKESDGVRYLGEYSAVVAAKPGLAAVTQVKAVSAGYSKIKVTWNGVSGASGYEIYRATKKNGRYSKIKTLSSKYRSYTDIGKMTGRTYYYKVRAYRSSGSAKYAGGYSSVVSARPILAKATKVKARKGGARKIKVTWKRVSGASGYKIYRSTKKKKGYKAVKTIKRGKTVQYTTAKLKKGKRYYFKVRAYRKAGGKNVYSGYSAAVSYRVR